MQVGFYLAVEIIQVIDWVRCASGNVYLEIEDRWTLVHAGPECIKGLMILSPWSKKLLLETDTFPKTSHLDV